MADKKQEATKEQEESAPHADTVKEAKRVEEEEVGYTVDAATGRPVTAGEAKKIVEDRNKLLSRG